MEKIIISEVTMSIGSLIVLGTASILAFITILYVLERSLYLQFKELHDKEIKTLNDIIAEQKQTQAMLLAKSPQDLFALQQILLCFTKNDWDVIPDSLFEKHIVPEKHFEVRFSHPAIRFMIETLSRYVKGNFEIEFPNKVYGATSDYKTEVKKRQDFLLNYLARAKQIIE